MAIILLFKLIIVFTLVLCLTCYVIDPSVFGIVLMFGHVIFGVSYEWVEWRFKFCQIISALMLAQLDASVEHRENN